MNIIGNLELVKRQANHMVLDHRTIRSLKDNPQSRTSMQKRCFQTNKNPFNIIIKLPATKT